MATQRVRGGRIELKAYAGVDPATGRKHYLYESVAADTGKRELDRRARALDRAAGELAESRRDRRRHPAAPKRATSKPKTDRTVADAVEAWWKHHGSKLAGAPKTRPLIDGIILPHLGEVKIALVAGTPPDDPDERDADVVYLAERWEEIARAARKTGSAPLAASTIHKCHGIVGAALRRAGHPISKPGLPTVEERESTTPLPEEMAAFLPHLAATGKRKSYTVTRRFRAENGDKILTYTVPAGQAEPSAMSLMAEAFALLVASGPRPVEVAAIARSQLDLDAGSLSLDARGVVVALDADGREVWVIRQGETAKRRRRTIALDARTLAALRRWLAFQQTYALRLGARPGPRSLLFSFAPDATEPISPKVFSRAFDRAVDRAVDAGVALPEGFHLYDMRHYGITSLLRAGRPVAAVARRFGTSPRMIHQRYEHAIPGDDAALADTMTAVWGDPAGDAEIIRLR